METRTGILRAMVLALALTLVSGCESEPGEPLRIGILVWPPYELALLARDLGYLDGAAIEFVDYESPATSERAYRDGAIDALMVTADYLLLLAVEDPTQRVILVTDFSEGGDVLVARPGIGSLGGLRGRRVGVERSALGAYVLHRATEISGIGIDEVTVVATDIPDQEQAYLDGQVDAVVTYEPIRTRLLNAGAVELFTSKEIPGEIVDVVVTNTDVVARHEKNLAVFTQGWFRALAHLRSDPDDAARRVAPREGLSPAEYLAALEGVRIPGRADNIALLSEGERSLAASLERLAGVMRQTGALAGPIAMPPLLEPRFVGGEK